MPEGRYYLRTECRTGPITDRLVVLEASEHADLGEIWMPAAHPVRIRVFGANRGVLHVMDRFREVGTPLATAVLHPVSEGAADGSAQDAVSVADLELAPGRYRIDVVEGSSGLLVSGEILVDANALADRPTIDLAYRKRTIRSVLTLNGQPAAGGWVRFERIQGRGASAGAIQIDFRRGGAANTTVFRPGTGSVHQTEVGGDGAFVVENAPDEVLWMTWFTDDGRQYARIWPDAPLLRLDLGGISIAGEVREAAGTPAANANVVLKGELGLPVAAAYATEDGRFSLPPAPPGRYRLTARTGSGRATAELALSPGIEPPFLPLQVDPGGTGTVEVQLRTRGGALAGAWMHVLHPDGAVARTGLALDDGSYSVTPVQAGEATVLWNHGGACVGAGQVTLDPGGFARYERTLPLGRLVELHCPDRRCAGKPLGLLDVTTEGGTRVAHHLSGASIGTMFSDDGRVGLGCLTPGAWELSFWTDERRWSADFELEPGHEETPVTVTVRPSPG